MRSGRKTIVITGASSGVGLALCHHFEKIGWHVIGIARDVRSVKIGNAALISANVGGWFLDSIKYHTKKIDVLVNNAGLFESAPLGKTSHSSIYNIIHTNLFGTITTTRQCLRLMKSGARIINIGSVAGTHGIKNQSVYCASKYGVNGFFEALQHELLPKKILLTNINPGGINTPLWSKHKYNGDLKRLLKTSDIVSLVDYICTLPKHVVFKNATLYPTNENH